MLILFINLLTVYIENTKSFIDQLFDFGIISLHIHSANTFVPK